MNPRSRAARSAVQPEKAPEKDNPPPPSPFSGLGSFVERAQANYDAQHPVPVDVPITVAVGTPLPYRRYTDEELDALPPTPVVVYPSAKARCGEFGGVLMNNQPCTREAGLGTRHLGTGRCRRHDIEPEEEAAPIKRRFLRALGRQPTTLLQALQASGIKNTATLERYRRRDPQFDLDVENLLARNRAIRVDLLEDSAFERANNPDINADSLRKFLFTNWAPDRYTTTSKRTIEHVGPGGGPIQKVSTHIHAKVLAVWKMGDKAIPFPEGSSE